MKKIVFIAIMAVCSLCASAQYYAGGALGFWHKDEKGVATNSLTILPELGMTLNDNWGIGATIGYTYNHLCGISVSSHLFEFNPYARYTYFRSDNGLVNLFVDGNIGFGAGWTHYKDGDDSKTACTWQIGAAPGIALNLTKRFSLVAHVGFLGYKGANNAAKAGGHVDEGGLLLNSNNISFGFYVNF